MDDRGRNTTEGLRGTEHGIGYGVVIIGPLLPREDTEVEWSVDHPVIVRAEKRRNEADQERETGVGNPEDRRVWREGRLSWRSPARFYSVS